MSDVLPRVLCVDDEPHILQAMRRTMSGQFDLAIAAGGHEGLARLRDDPPYAVIVSDLRMPGVDGISLLRAAAERSPDTVRILLTGNGDFTNAIAAVNEGNVFRFLTKPCAASVLRTAILAGCRQHELVVSERVLLSDTLRGSVRALSELVALVHPAVGAQTSRIRRTVVQLADALQAPNAWEIEIVALLSTIGTVTLPEVTLQRMHLGRELLTSETRLLERIPAITAEVIAHIPRMEGVQKALLAQGLRWDGAGSSDPALAGGGLPLAARLVKLATDLDVLESRGVPRGRAILSLQARTGWYDPRALAALAALDREQPSHAREDAVPVGALVPGMILAEDLFGHEGVLMVARGNEVSRTLVSRIRDYWDDDLRNRVVRVLRPAANEEDLAA